jgi:nitrogen fixation protein FixH
MERRKRTVIAVLIAFIIVVAVFSSFAINLFGRGDYQIHLPDLSQGDDSDGAGDQVDGADRFVRVEVTPQTVQSVIAALSRPQSYYREITVELWAGENSSVTTAQTWVDGGWTRCDVTAPGGMIQHNLVDGATRWLWYDDSRDVLTLPAQQDVSDLIQRIPTYEDVLQLSQEEITDTGYQDYSGLECVFVEIAQEELSSAEQYWISVSSGLLVAAERVKDGQLVYRMTALSIESPAPLSSSFTLPDGTVLHTVGEE